MIQLYQGNAMDILSRDLGVFDGVISDPPYASKARALRYS